MYFIHFLLPVIAVTVTTVTCYDELSSDLQMYYLEEAEYHFNEFAEKFGKNYGKIEREYRFRVFKENLEKINTLNIRVNFNLYGITQFADMTKAEFLNYANCLRVEDLNMTDVNVIKLNSSSDANYPAELDYRSYRLVTEVKNQGTCQDCYIFSAVGNIEGQYAKNHQQLISLSEQEGLDCLATLGCNFGGLPDAMMRALAGFGGLVTESSYPYYGYQKACTVDKSQVVVRVTGGNEIQCDEDGLVQALNMYGPLSVGIGVSDNLRHFTGGRVFNDPSCGTTPSHAVLLIGYGTAPDGPYWLIKNSWGTNWGEQGYFRLARGVGMCAIGNYAATATLQ